MSIRHVGPGRAGAWRSLGTVLLAPLVLVLLGGCATGPARGRLLSGHGRRSLAPSFLADASKQPRTTSRSGQGAAEGSAGGFPSEPSSDSEVLAPFLACASPAEFVELQRGVDMPRLVEGLDEWSAVRLGALGPLREDAAEVLNRKRAAFLLAATERYGLGYAEVFALFVLHSAHDDEVEEVLRLLAGDKRLGQTLALMPAVREELKARGMPLSAYPERAEQAGDVPRGLGRAMRDVLSTSPTSDGARYMELSARRAQLPPPYQQAIQEVERALVERHFSMGSVAVGSFDAMTFGVPLGFYYLAAGTGQGAYSLSQGQYEQATRELAPAMLLGALYLGGKGMRGMGGARGPLSLEVRLEALREMGRRLEARLGVEGLRELARDIQASRKAGHFVAAGGMDAALALHEARGDVARAQAVMSKARPEAASSSARPIPRSAGATERPGGLASLVDEKAGLTHEVVETRFAAVELECPGPRLPRDVAVLEKQRPSLDAPLPGARGSPRWSEYVAYYEKRLGEIEKGKAVEGPLRWEPYELMRGWFARGLAFEHLMVRLLRADAELPRSQRRFLMDFDRPRIERYVGVWKPKSGLRYVDVLIIEEGPVASRLPRVEALSFKSRNLALLEEKALEARMIADASEALAYYGETLNIRRPSLAPLLREGSEVPVQRVRLIYEGGALKPENVNVLKEAVEQTRRQVPGVEVSFQ